MNDHDVVHTPKNMDVRYLVAPWPRAIWVRILTVATGLMAVARPG